MEISIANFDCQSSINTYAFDRIINKSFHVNSNSGRQAVVVRNAIHLKEVCTDWCGADGKYADI